MRHSGGCCLSKLSEVFAFTNLLTSPHWFYLNTEHWTLGTEYWILNTEYWILPWILDHLLPKWYWPRILYSEYRTLNTKYRILNSVYWLLSTEYWILNTALNFRSPAAQMHWCHLHFRAWGGVHNPFGQNMKLFFCQKCDPISRRIHSNDLH